MALPKVVVPPAEITAPALWIVLARAYAAVVSCIERGLEQEGIGLSDFMVLEVLLHKGPLPMCTIAEKVLLANASMTSAVDRLHELGFVRRQSTEEDRRVRLVVLTPAGRRFITALYQTHAGELESLMDDLSQGERKQLRRGLRTIGLAAKKASAPR